jgi:hypothetical protein
MEGQPMANGTVLESINDCPTVRNELPSAIVRRMFDEAEIAVRIRQLDYEHDVRRELLRLVASLSASW